MFVVVKQKYEYSESTSSYEKFSRKLRDFYKETFFVCGNDSLGINHDNSNDGCFQMQREFWTTCNKNDFIFTTNDIDSDEKIFQVQI